MIISGQIFKADLKISKTGDIPLNNNMNILRNIILEDYFIFQNSCFRSALSELVMKVRSE